MSSAEPAGQLQLFKDEGVHLSMVKKSKPGKTPKASRAVKAEVRAKPAKSAPAPLPEEKPARRAVSVETAESMGKRQRDISISEFFQKNRHLLGFDNPRKALLTTVKEAVDNALDACEEGGILPDLRISIEPVKGYADRYIVSVRDNGPGIVAKQIPNIFGKLLYGSKFHRLKMARGQQGIGISAAGMYGQMTTGKPVRILSRPGDGKPAHYFEIALDTSKNEPVVLKEEKGVAFDNGKGTEVSIELTCAFQRGRTSVDEYLLQTAIANPHARIVYKAPEEPEAVFERATKEFPKQAREIKPHPKGIELGMLIKMAKDTKARQLSSFLQHDFSRVSSRVAQGICAAAKLPPNSRPSRIAHQEAEAVYNAIQAVKIMNPPTDCLAPIGEAAIVAGLQKQVKAEYFTATTRPPSVYRGNPFQIEVGIAYGGELPQDELARVLRFANRVPLLYQPGACAVTEAVMDTSWRNYKISQSRGALPNAPMVIMVHMASVWVPFTSEAKEAVAHYPEILKELKLAIQESGRKLLIHVNAQAREHHEAERRSIFERYINEVVAACGDMARLNRDELGKNLRRMAKKATGLAEDADLNAPKGPKIVIRGMKKKKK
jgi:DNA topoisomerase VI subunit B